MTFYLLIFPIELAPQKDSKSKPNIYGAALMCRLLHLMLVAVLGLIGKDGRSALFLCPPYEKKTNEQVRTEPMTPEVLRLAKRAAMQLFAQDIFLRSPRHCPREIDAPIRKVTSDTMGSRDFDIEFDEDEDY